MKYEDYVIDKMVSLEEYISKEKENLSTKDIKVAKLLLEAYHLARLRGYGAEIASITYYISTTVEYDENGSTIFNPNKVNIDLLSTYLVENNANKTLTDFLLKKNEKSKEERRTAGFGSNL